MGYLIGQRVILNNEEIGTVTVPPEKGGMRASDYYWVYSPKRGYACHFRENNIKPLPGGQL
jgi:hypothetical protein